MFNQMHLCVLFPTIAVFFAPFMLLSVIFPLRTIEIEDNTTVFGILLLPSIKQIIFSPNHSKIKNIQRIKKLSEDNLEKEGWIKSNPVKTK